MKKRIGLFLLLLILNGCASHQPERYYTCHDSI